MTEHPPATDHSGTHSRAPIRVRAASSVRFRLTVTVGLVVGLSLLGGGVLLVRWVEATLVNDLRTRNQQMLAVMAETMRQGSIPQELVVSIEPTGEGTLGLVGRLSTEQVVSGTQYFLNRHDDVGEKVFRLQPFNRLEYVSQKIPSRSDGWIEVSQPVSTQWGDLTLHAVAPVEEIDGSVKTLTAALWLGLPVLSVGAGMMTWFITGRALAPVAVMTRRVRELSATTLDARVPVPPTDDEIAQLAQTMNDMLDRLQHASLAQRQFVSDASHELRSPVASIRAQLETALRYPDDVDWPAIARIVLDEDTRLEHLVGNLLAMARLEEGRLGPRGEVDLDDLVMSQSPRMTGVHLDLSAVSAGRVWGNRDELTSVVRNLLDNAARHSHTEVTVSVREQGPWVVMAVADDGPGIAVEHRERVFERFARLQEGRSRDQGGTGLGLALSKRIVEHHGGRIHVEDAPGGGARFVVALPAAAWIGDEQPDVDDTVDDGADDERGRAADAASGALEVDPERA